MAFDSSDPTGGDTDLSSDTLGMILILPEDGDTLDPDDEGRKRAGVINFNFMTTSPAAVCPSSILKNKATS